MTYQEIITKINDFLVEDFEVNEADIKPESGLKETLDLDSLDYIDIKFFQAAYFIFGDPPNVVSDETDRSCQ